MQRHGLDKLRTLFVSVVLQVLRGTRNLEGSHAKGVSTMGYIAKIIVLVTLAIGCADSPASQTVARKVNDGSTPRDGAASDAATHEEASLHEDANVTDAGSRSDAGSCSFTCTDSSGKSICSGQRGTKKCTKQDSEGLQICTCSEDGWIECVSCVLP